MNTLSTDTITSNLGGVADTVRSTIDTLDLSGVADTLEDASSTVVDVASDLADAAGSVSRLGGRVVVRTVRRTGRFVGQHPKGAFTSATLVIALLAALAWYRRSQVSTTAKSDLKVAA